MTTPFANSVTGAGTIAGYNTEVEFLHREPNNTTPVLMYATVTVPLSYDDIVAAVWTATAGMSLDEVDGDPAGCFGLAKLVLETLVSDNAGVSEARYAIQEIRPGNADYDELCRVRALVTQCLFTPATPALPVPRPARRTHQPAYAA